MGISGSVRSRAASGNARPRCAARSGRRRWSGWRSTVNTWRHHRYRDTRSVSSICTPERTVGGHVTNGAANARYSSPPVPCVATSPPRSAAAPHTVRSPGRRHGLAGLPKHAPETAIHQPDDHSHEPKRQQTPEDEEDNHPEHEDRFIAVRGLLRRRRPLIGLVGHRGLLVVMRSPSKMKHTTPTPLATCSYAPVHCGAAPRAVLWASARGAFPPVRDGRGGAGGACGDGSSPLLRPAPAWGTPGQLSPTSTPC